MRLQFDLFRYYFLIMDEAYIQSHVQTMGTYLSGSRRMHGNLSRRHFAVIERSGQKCHRLIVVIYVPSFLLRNRTGELFFGTNRTGGTEAEIAPTTHHTFT